MWSLHTSWDCHMTWLGDHVISSIHSGEGVRQGQLVNWYLSEIEGDIDSVEMLAEKKVLVEKVIERLIHHVRTRDTSENSIRWNFSWDFTRVVGRLFHNFPCTYLRQQFFEKIFLREPCFSLSGWVWKYIPPELLHNTLLVVDFFPCRTTFCCHCWWRRKRRRREILCL